VLNEYEKGHDQLHPSKGEHGTFISIRARLFDNGKRAWLGFTTASNVSIMSCQVSDKQKEKNNNHTH